jgi:hypothetical protein
MKPQRDHGGFYKLALLFFGAMLGACSYNSRLGLFLGFCGMLCTVLSFIAPGNLGKMQ